MLIRYGNNHHFLSLLASGTDSITATSEIVIEDLGKELFLSICAVFRRTRASRQISDSQNRAQGHGEAAAELQTHSPEGCCAHSL